MAVADGNGLPIAIGIASGQRNEVGLVEETLDQCVVEEPERLIGDKAYDSNKLDDKLKQRGIDMIAPVNPAHVNNKQDGRKLRRYRRRWKIERLFSWLLGFRRLVTRYEHKAQNFLGFLRFGCAMILLRRVVG
jgi:transposase